MKESKIEIQAGAQNSSFFNVKDFGAKGDGSTPDTAAIQKALDAAGKVQGTVYFPSGNYMCRDLKMRSYTTVLGEPQWSTRYEALRNGPVFILDSPSANCIFDLTGTYGCHIQGIRLGGHWDFWAAKWGQHGIMINNPTFTQQDNCVVLDQVNANSFKGHGIYLKRVKRFTIRHSRFVFNRWNGVCFHGRDGMVLDTEFTTNSHSGFGTEVSGSNILFTHNRNEWNYEYGLKIFGNTNEPAEGWVVTSNMFDRNYGAGIGASHVRNSVFTGNVNRRNGSKVDAGDTAIDVERGVGVVEGIGECCEMLIRSCKGLAITGNATFADWGDNSGQLPISPDYTYWTQNNAGCLITENVSSSMVAQELNKGGNASDFTIVDNLYRQGRRYENIF